MRFQRKILLNYVLLLFISVVIIIVLYYNSSRKRYAEQEYSYLQTLSGQMMQQLEMEYRSMQEMTESLLSDPVILDNLKILATIYEDSDYRVEAKKKIMIRLNTYHIVKNFYRVLIYNNRGDIFASYDFDERKIKNMIPEEQEVWITGATGKKGRTGLVLPHEDPWGMKASPVIYGVIREILGSNMGYLEVQKTEDSLKRIFEIFDDNIRVAAVYDGGGALYGLENEEMMQYYEGLGKSEKHTVTDRKNPVTGRNEIVSSVYSELTGVTILLAEDRRVITQKMSGPLWMAFWILLLFVSLSILFIVRISQNLARPINELRRQMEQTNTENMGEAIHIENSMDEITALTNTYERILRRLKESLIQEKNLSYLQLQARYDLLQAQINPHFFHNVLNVISSRGLMLGDETICEICGSLSGMLRYATGNKIRYATIAEELIYLKQYLYLMKLRYQHKLEYLIEVDETLGSQLVPKIAFQQIVENSIKHGFNGKNDVMKITVTIKLTESGEHWIVVFTDNGEGIKKETVEQLEQQMIRMRDSLLNRHENIEMEIGGMGLLNTYARLVLFFGDDVKLEIMGLESGTTVVITVPVSAGAGEDVSSIGSGR